MNKAKGMGTIEVLLAMSLFMLYATFVMGAMLFSLQSTKTPNTRREALYYAEEGIDAVNYLKKGALTNLTDGTFGVTFSGTDWSFVPTQDITAPGFVRTITITSPDADTRKVVSRVNWDNGIDTGFEELISFVTNWNESVPLPGGWGSPVYAGTYNAPENYNPIAMRIYNGYLNLVADNNTVYNLDVTDMFNVSLLTSAAISTPVSDVAFAGNKIYVASSGNTSELRGMIINSPTSISIYGTLNMATNTDAQKIDFYNNTIFVTRTSNGTSDEYNLITDNGLGVFTVTKSMNYASTLLNVKANGQYSYVGVGVAGNDLLVINNNPLIPTVAATLATPAGNENVKQFIIGNYLYRLTTSVGMLVYNITNQTSPVLVSTTSTGGAITSFDLDTVNNYLFLGVANTSSEFQVYDIANPASPVLFGSYNSPVDITALTFDATNNRVIAGSSTNASELVFFTPQ